MKDLNRMLLIGIFLLGCFHLFLNRNEGRYQIFEERNYDLTMIDTKTGDVYAKSKTYKWEKIINIKGDVFKGKVNK